MLAHEIAGHKDYEEQLSNADARITAVQQSISGDGRTYQTKTANIPSLSL